MANSVKVSGVKHLPPDAAQQQLAADINALLSSEAKVTFFRKRDDSDRIHYVMIYSYGTSARCVTQSAQPFFDRDGIVKSVNRWIGNLGQQNRWGLTP